MSLKVNPGVSPGDRTVAAIALINLHIDSKLSVVKITGAAKEQGQLFFKLCSDHLSIEAIPRTSLKLDLLRLKDKPLAKYETMMWTPQFVVLKNQAGQEITLRKDGRMVIRRAASEPEAHRAAIDVMSVIESDLVNES
jgi:hypothetical protein